MADTSTIHSADTSWLPVLNPAWNSSAPALTVPYQRPVVCGSGPQCDFRLALDGVAERHCVVEYRTGGLFVVEAQAAVWINDVPAPVGSRIEPGDQVAFGPAIFQVSTLALDGTSPGMLIPMFSDGRAVPRGIDPDDQQAKRLQKWQKHLQERSDALSRQSETLDGRFADLLKVQAECESRSREIDADRESLRSDRLALEEERQQVQSTQETLSSQQQQAEEELRQAKTREESLQEREQDLEVRLRRLAETGDELTEQAAFLESEQAELRQQQSELEEQCRRSEEASTVCEQELQMQEVEQRQAELDALEARLTVVQADIEASERALRDQQTQIETREETLAEREARLRDSKESIQQATAEVKHREEAVCNALKKQERASEVLLRRQRELDARAGSVQDRETELDVKRQEQRDLQTAVELQIADVERREAEIAESQAQIADLSECDERISLQGNHLPGLEAQVVIDESEVSTTDEAHLLQQIEELQAEVKAASDGQSTVANELQEQLQAQQSLIGELTGQLQLAEKTMIRLQNASGSQDVDDQRATQFLIEERDQKIAALEQQLEETLAVVNEVHSAGEAEADASGWEQQLVEPASIIRELQGQPVNAQSGSLVEASAATDEEIQRRSRELDDRTTLLDRRDEELGEWNRRLQNTEEEMEGERRQLQEARQQLELARAELQVWIEEPPDPSPHGPVWEDPSEVTGDVPSEPVDMEETAETGEGVSELRSELASLFGLAGNSEAASWEPPPVEEYVDVSAEGGDTIIMSFEQAQGVLLEAQSVEDDTSVEGEDSDYVTRYMEQLLSRSRSAAGDSLPDELSGTSEKTEPAAVMGSGFSFIDQHMNSAEGQTLADSASGEGIGAAETEEEAEPMRRGIDLESLRQDMDSFRKVSVRSAQKALESHAMKKERSGLNSRQAVVAAAATITLVALACQLMGVINAWIVVGGLAIVTAGTIIELLRCQRMIRMLVREHTQATSTIPAPQEVPATAAEVVPTDADGSSAESREPGSLQLADANEKSDTSSASAGTASDDVVEASDSDVQEISLVVSQPASADTDSTLS